MPTSTYVARNKPPTRVDTLLTHPGEALMAALSLLCGPVFAADAFVPTAIYSIALGEQPTPIALGIGAFMTVGGALVLAGLFSRTKNYSLAWAIERYGWHLLAAGWAGYALAVYVNSPWAFTAYGSGAALVALAVLRATALTSLDRGAKRLRRAATGQNTTVQKGDPDG